MNELALAQWLRERSTCPVGEHGFTFISFMAALKIKQSSAERTLFYPIVFITGMEGTPTEVCGLGKGINVAKIKSSMRDRAKACDVLSLLGLSSAPWSMKAKEPD